MTALINPEHHEAGAWVSRAHAAGVGTSVSTQGLGDPASPAPWSSLQPPLLFAEVAHCPRLIAAL